MTTNELTWDQTLRYRLLEIVLQWEGRLTTNHLCTAFNIGRQQASKDINRYIKNYSPKGIEYDAKIKGFKSTKYFVPHFSEGKVDEYLAILHQEKKQSRRSKEQVTTLPMMDLGNGHIEILDVPIRHIDPIIARGLVQAARYQLRVDVDYVSLSSGERSGRNIVPHAIVYDGIRWHVRAYCEKKGDYLDFVMSRFRGAPDLLDVSVHGREHDHEWNKQTIAKIVPNPELNSIQKDIVATDYAMDKGILLITQRIPLMHYSLDRLQVSYDGEHHENPMQFPLILANREELIAQGCRFKLKNAALL